MILVYITINDERVELNVKGNVGMDGKELTFFPDSEPTTYKRVPMSTIKSFAVFEG